MAFAVGRMMPVTAAEISRMASRDRAFNFKSESREKHQSQIVQRKVRTAKTKTNPVIKKLKIPTVIPKANVPHEFLNTNLESNQ